MDASLSDTESDFEPEFESEGSIEDAQANMSKPMKPRRSSRRSSRTSRASKPAKVQYIADFWRRGFRIDTPPLRNQRHHQQLRVNSQSRR